MMRLARRASVLVAFCLLTSAATAYAECAWVLWAERATVPVMIVPNGFERLAAYGDYGSCARAAKAKAERQAAEMRDGGGLYVKGKEPKVYSRIKDQWIVEATQDDRADSIYRVFSDRFMCLPDTMDDPRAPKGK